MLDRAPELRRISVLIRSKALLSGRERFEKILNTSPVFGPLHERFGAQFSRYVAERVEVVEGELSEVHMALGEPTRRRLLREVDLGRALRRACGLQTPICARRIAVECGRDHERGGVRGGERSRVVCSTYRPAM